jgi:hypothetical protein
MINPWNNFLGVQLPFLLLSGSHNPMGFLTIGGSDGSRARFAGARGMH